MKTLLDTCVCGAQTVEVQTIHALPMMRCTACGVHRQHVPKTPAELAAWYRTEYFAGTYYHTRAHDEGVALTRLKAYAAHSILFAGAKLLDVGSGNGAFVDAARAAGYEAWGQDLATQSESAHVYVGALAEVGFPTDEFDVVTMHDVLEHVTDPMAFHAAGYKFLPAAHPLFHEAYSRDARTVFKDVLDVDYFVAYNGVMRYGRTLEAVDPHYGVEWWPKMFVSKEALAMQAKLYHPAAPYLVLYVVSGGMYKHWLAEFPLAQVRQVVNAVAKAFGFRVVVVGAEWDKGSGGEQMATVEPWINLTGQTTYDQLLGVLRGASLVLGWPSGLTILGPVLRTPSLLFWNSYFCEAFWHAACPPSGTYRPMSTKNVSIPAVLEAVAALLGVPAGT